MEGGLTGRKGRLRWREDWEEGTTEVEGVLTGRKGQLRWSEY